MEMDSTNIVEINKDTMPILRESIFRNVRNLLVDLECDYPGFSQWLRKVFDELVISYDRRILLCLGDSINEILGVSIVKTTKEENKICTLRVRDSYQRRGIGTKLLLDSIKLIQDKTPLITVSESHLNRFRPFLEKNGFVLMDKVYGLYIKNQYEYFFNKKYTRDIALMSIKPCYATEIQNGKKKIEFRKKPIKESVQKVIVYSSLPCKRIIGYFAVEEVVHGSPLELWERYGHVGCISRTEYDKYFSGRTDAYGIVIDRFVQAKTAINPLDFDSTFAAPQSFQYFNNVSFRKWISDQMEHPF